MTRYVALLRGINVGAVNIKMVDLTRVFTDLGFERVETVLASGNVLFDSDTTEPSALKTDIESALTREFHYEAWVFVLEKSELQNIVDNFPFVVANPDRHSYVMVAADPAVLTELGALSGGLDPLVEQVAVGDGVLYWEVEKGMTVTGAFGRHTGKTRYKAHTTTRNINTLHKILK
ncbi:uncharacterized protein (DUF1697 family) [Rhodococcus sp. 27YEA15]|uniref:DUF1697 domain-containing protein n=1 Tax=Rhodococcus sp. 27YEA15 TaxID=3156259 RepID=UPI003C7CF05E